MKNKKKYLRKFHINLRDKIPKQIREEKSKKIINILISLDLYKKSKNIFTFVSFSSEVNTHDFIKKSFELNKNIFVPYIEDNIMKICKINKIEDLEKGHFNILEPKNKISADPKLIDLVITPGVAFDKNNYRIGYGKGYYDKFFYENNSLIKIGVCFSENYVENLPHDKNDIPVDFVINF